MVEIDHIRHINNVCIAIIKLLPFVGKQTVLRIKDDYFKMFSCSYKSFEVVAFDRRSSVITL